MRSDMSVYTTADARRYFDRLLSEAKDNQDVIIKTPEGDVFVLQRITHTTLEASLPKLGIHLSRQEITDCIRETRERYQLARKIEFQIIDNLGNSMGQRFKGRLSDISRGGLAMKFNLAQKKHIRVLFGRKLHISIPVAGKSPELNVYGAVLSISPTEEKENEYKLHFVFDAPMEQEALQQVLG
ncbi:MAG: hypothetical protein D3904_09075 [Candidatus Electrothrix sp. EH2]|nr:hypothetical protein [Candidatus Electrothrix sp. EH2]